jgi:hypothetical protein
MTRNTLERRAEPEAPVVTPERLSAPGLSAEVAEIRDREVTKRDRERQQVLERLRDVARFD